jgi:hypothetical protein
MAPSTFIDQVALMAQINPVIKQAQEVKRSGDVKRAREILEDCLDEYISAGIPEDHAGFAPLYKSIGKLCLLQNDFELAAAHYIFAITAYKQMEMEQEAWMNLMHLGCCHPEFRKSEFFLDYRQTLLGNSNAPALPDNVVDTLYDLGLSTYSSVISKDDGRNRERSKYVITTVMTPKSWTV